MVFPRGGPVTSPTPDLGPGADGWGADWTRRGLIAGAVELAKLGFGILRVYHPVTADRCSCGNPHDGKGTNLDASSIGKHPIGNEWPDHAVHDPERVRTMLGNPGNRSYGIVPPPGVFAWDIDGSVPAKLGKLAETLGELPATRRHASGNGEHAFFRWPPDMPGGSGNLFGVVTRWPPGGQVVGPGSVHAATGKLYRVLVDAPIAELPRRWAGAVLKMQAPTASSAATTDCLACGPLEGRYGENERYAAILRLAMRLHTMGHAHDVQWIHVRDHLAPRFDPPLTEAEIRSRFERATADQARMDQKAAAWQSEHPAALGPPPHLVRQSRAAWYFAQMAGDRVRFDHGRKRWLIWSGHRWQPDEDGSIQRMWLEVLATRYAQALERADEKERARLAAEVQVAGALNSAITAGLAIASSMEPLATTADAWDRDPWVLGCENGVVDLRTGLLRPGRPEEMISRSTGIVYDPNASCSRWMWFLVEVFAGDDELADWYGLLIGTSLIGLALEVLAIHYGLGNNGKSVAVGALRKATGDYAVVIPVETLANAKRTAGEATPDLMALRGARIAFTSEPDQAAKLRGGVLKRLASVDRMTGRPLYGGTLTWEPTHLVHLATNHLPAVDDASEGFWRRVALVPWNVRFRKPGEDGDAPPEDADLAATLALEAPGILAWAVRWAVVFAAGRKLHPFPAVVRVRTDTYRADEDKLGAFVVERVVYERVAAVAVGVLFGAYRDWCESENTPHFDRVGQKAFSRGFEERGHGVGRGKDAKNRVIFTGARLRVGTDPEHPEHLTPFAGTPHVKDVSEEVRQGPPDAPDAPEPVASPDPHVPEMKLTIDWPTP